MRLDLQAVVETLRTGEETNRRRAVEELGRSGAIEAIAPLLLAVGDESWPVRQAAVEGLAAFPDAEILPALEVALRDGENAGLRNASMEIYTRLAERSVGQLRGLLSDPDEEIRNFAAVMLGAVRAPSAVAALITSLSDPDLNVKHAAAASLGQIGSAEAVPALVAVLQSEPWLTYPAISALGDIGDATAAPALIPLLRDEAFRGPVLEALGRMAGRDVLREIVPHLHDPDPAIRNAAIRAVVDIEQRSTASGETLDPEVQAALRHDELIEHLLQNLESEDVEIRRTAVITLGWLRESRATSRLVEMFGDPALREHAAHALVSVGWEDPEAFARGLDHPDDTVRQGTLRCLSWIAPEGGTDLVAPLIHDPSVEVRAEAAAAIGRLGDEDAAMLLFELLGDEADLIQESAADALARMPPARVVPMLVQALAGTDEEGRIRAAFVLGLVRDPATVPGLVAASRDPRERVRRAVLKALGEIEAPGVGTLLRAALADESSLVREQAALSLGRLQEPDAPEVLLPLLEDPDPRLRFAALKSLGQVRQPEAVPRILPFLTDVRKELRFAAAEALGEIRAVAAVRPLVELLRESDRNLRRAAAEALGSIGDLEAVPSLLVALEDEHWSVRCAAATALGRIRSGKCLNALVARLQDRDATVRRAVVAALGEIGDARAVADLAAALEEPGLEATAAESLRRLGAAALPGMERAYVGLSPSARRLVVDLAGRVEGAPSSRLLLAALSDENAAVRAEAALALGEGGYREALRQLLDRKGSDTSADVRRAAATALRRLAPR